MNISRFARNLIVFYRNFSPSQKTKNFSPIFFTKRFSQTRFDMSNILISNLPYQKPKVENLIDLIGDGLSRHSSETIFVDATSDRAWTGKEVETAVLAIARFLIEQYDLKKGDVCSIYANENDLVAVLSLALISVGATYHFLSDRSSGWDVHDTVAVINSRYLFSSHELLKKMKSNKSLANLEDKLHMISLDNPYEDFKNGCKSILDLFDRTNPRSVQRIELSFQDLIKRANIEPETDYAVLQFSSGTTGKPKPIPRTHKNLVHSVASVEHKDLLDLKPGVVLSGIIPITHRPGLWAILATVQKGNKLVIWNELGGVENALATIEKHKVNIFSSSLPFLTELACQGIESKDKYDISSLKQVITAGAKIVNPEVPRSIVKQFKLDSLRQCFGMTESGWCFLIEQNIAMDNYLSVGHVVPGMEAIIMDRVTKQKLGPNERGEIALKGPQIFPGYLTDKHGILNRADFTEDGWFMIGDEGYYDREGLVFITGRYKEKMLFSNDYKFFPTEIEAVINLHPSVKASCVVRLPNENKDYVYDIARAYVILKDNQDLAPKDILDYLDERIPEAFLEGGIVFLKQFPRMNNGKVDKQALSRMK